MGSASTNNPIDSFEAVAPAASPVELTAEAAAMPSASMGSMRDLRPLLKPYEGADWRSGAQLALATAMLVGGWVCAVWALSYGYLASLPFCAVIAVAIVRLFIIFHDCGHGSFSGSKTVNDVVGSIVGIVVFTPFRYWNYAHSVHHATSSDLGRRGVGDIWTLTTAEWDHASTMRRFYYRAYHNPIVMLTVGPLIKFLIIERIVTRPRTTPTRIKRSVHLTNVGIVVAVAAMGTLLGWGTFLAIQLTAITIGGSTAIWLFYVQHRFDGAYWSHRGEWDFVQAGLAGSSYFRLGPVLQFASGNIGFHHIHHLDARIPNYKLPQCHREQPSLAPTHVLSLRTSFTSRRLKLWDETTGSYVGYPTQRSG